MYKALIKFRDIGGEIYNAGDDYPRGEVAIGRIQQLLTSDNRTGAPVIVEKPNPEIAAQLAEAQARIADLEARNAELEAENAELSNWLAEAEKASGKTQDQPRPVESMNRQEVRDELTTLGVVFSPTAGVAELRGVLQQARAAQ